MPADDYDLKARRFRDGTTGKLVSRSGVRGLIDKLLDTVRSDAARIAGRYESGSINLAQFEIEMRELLKSAHIVAASVGRGGRARMTQADWGRIGAKIKWQYQYLAKFTRKLEQGRISKIATASRARSYASSVFVSFSNMFQKAQTEFVQDGKNPARVRLVTNSQEGCTECAADEAEGWMSVDDMKEIGTRICGDFCRCDLIFEDEERSIADRLKGVRVKLAVVTDE
jgi:hypothetical protein